LFNAVVRKAIQGELTMKYWRFEITDLATCFVLLSINAALISVFSGGLASFPVLIISILLLDFVVLMVMKLLTVKRRI
jgi:hypothetical protein